MGSQEESKEKPLFFKKLPPGDFLRGHHLSWKKNPSVRRWLKRRAAIEPIISHLKYDNGMDRNHLKGTDGDRMNAILAGCGFNLRKLLRSFLALIFGWLLVHRFEREDRFLPLSFGFNAA